MLNGFFACFGGGELNSPIRTPIFSLYHAAMFLSIFIYIVVDVVIVIIKLIFF